MFNCLSSPNKVLYRRYHCVNMSDLRSDPKSISFVISPANSLVHLYEQCDNDLGDVLHSHALLVSRLTKKDSLDWLTDSYRLAKRLEHQFKRTWWSVKNPLNRSQLHCQIAW